MENTHQDNTREAWIGAFLLVIPGATVLGVGTGMLIERLIPCSLMGLGAGALIWGLVASFRRS